METSLKYRDYSDNDLLTLITQQDSDALEEIYDRHAQTAYNVIVRIVQNQAIADEILQETFWQVWQKARDFRGGGAPAAWLYRIARNKSLDHLRRRQARPQLAEFDLQVSEQIPGNRLISDRSTIERSTEQHWEREYLSQALARIPEDQRTCLELAYFEGMSQRQIAEVTDTPLGTVKTRLRMGLEKLERIYRAAGYRVEDVV